MRRLAAGALAALTMGMAWAPDARAAGTCSYDAATKTVTATAEAGPSIAVLVVTAGSMTFDEATCSGATPANTTAVNIAASGRQIRLYLATAVTNTTFTIAGGGTFTYVSDDKAGGVQWKSGRLADGRWVVDLDSDGVAEVVAETAGILLAGFGGNDTLSGAGGFKGPGGETAAPASSAMAYLEGGFGDDTITGPGVLQPQEGDDTLIAGPAGEHTLWYIGAPEAVLMKPDLSGTESGADGVGGTDTYTGFGSLAGFTVHGTQQGDRIYGGPGDDDIFAYDGADQVVGLGGDDQLVGNAGADTLEGGLGDDFVHGKDLGDPGADAPNVLRGGPGRDVIFGGAAGDEIKAADDEADFVSCYGGTDTGTADRGDTLDECEFAAPALSFAPASASIDEGGETRFTLTLSYPLEIAVAVDVLTVDGTAKGGADYTPVARRVTFPPGETAAFVDVVVPADDQDEPAESFTLSMANPSNAPTMGSDVAIVVNDKTAVTTSVTVGPEPGTGTGGTYLAPPTVVVKADQASEVRCVLDPAATPATFADIPAGACPYTGAGQAVSSDGAHTLCAASTSSTTGETSPVTCASWATDATRPSVTCGSAPSFKVGDKGKLVTASVADATSGPVIANLSAPADTATSGEKTVAFVARDKAGNATTAKCAYSVSSVALCGQPIVLLSVEPVGRRVRLSGLAAPAYAGKTVTIVTSGRPVGTAIVARDGSFSVVVRSSTGARARYRATLPDGGSTPAHKLSRSLAITKRSGTTVHGRILTRKSLRPMRVSFYRQNTCTSQRVFATAKVSKSGAFKIKLAGPVAPEPIALYRVKARIGKGSRYTSYTLPIVVTASASR